MHRAHVSRTSVLYTILAAVSLMIVASPFAMAAGGGVGIEGYGAASHVNVGTIVVLDGKNSQTVKPATQAQQQNMFGVAVDRGQLPVTVSGGAVKNETYVAVSGAYNVLVSTQNGSIKSGDYIALSSIDGVGMRADTTQKTVFGRAQSSFDGTGVTLGQSPLKDDSGKTDKTVKIGLIPVTVDVKRNPNIKSTKADVPPFLQRLGQEIANHKVSPIRIYLSLAIVAASIIIALMLLYSGVRNSIISIGRNPMSKKSIFRALIQVILTSLIVLIVGLFAVYLLLKL